MNWTTLKNGSLRARSRNALYMITYQRPFRYLLYVDGKHQASACTVRGATDRAEIIERELSEAVAGSRQISLS